MNRLRNGIWRFWQSRQEPEKLHWDPDYRRAPFPDETWWQPARREIATIRAAWLEDEEYNRKFGHDLLVIIYEKLPDRSRMFPEIWHSGRHWKRSTHFQHLASRMQNVLVYTIQHLDEHEKVQRYLHEIGGLHARYMGRGFRVAYWELFKEAMQTTISKRIDGNQFGSTFNTQQRHETVELWGCLAVYMIRHMFVGFCDVFAVLDAYVDGQALPPNTHFAKKSDVERFMDKTQHLTSNRKSHDH